MEEYAINDFKSYIVVLDTHHYARSFHLLEFLAEAFRCHVHHFQCLTVPVLKTQVSGKFLHTEVNLIIQHIIVQDQDGQNIKDFKGKL